MESKYFLQQAQSEMENRAFTYDKNNGERSMRKTVAMFNTLTGHVLTEEQGWKFMCCLKLVRSEQGHYRADNYIDGAAYFSLAGESASCNDAVTHCVTQTKNDAKYAHCDTSDINRFTEIDVAGNTILHEIAEIIGSEKAIKIGQKFGGSKVYFPAIANRTHPLTLILGIADAQKLCDHYKGDTLYLPSKTKFKRIRDELIRNEYNKLNGVKGFSRADFLAIKYGLSRRYILYIIKAPSTSNNKAA